VYERDARVLGARLSDQEGPKLRWPQRGDRLFKPALFPAADAEIPATAAGRQELIGRGYKIAADMLIQAAFNDPSRKGLLIYPIVFCYRQFLELSLKDQISRYAKPKGLIAPPTFHTHDLKKLLRLFVLVCRDTTPGDSEDIAFFIRSIKEFDRMDPKSFTFRYATDQNGDPYPISANRIDIDGLRGTMEGIETFLSQTDQWLATVIDES
jgi:hypothetical protein